MASQKAELVTLREVVMARTRSLKTTEARCKELEGMVEFRDAADARRESIHKQEVEELERDMKTIEDSRSQAQIAWDQHEQVSNELAAVRGELGKAQAALQEESRKAMLQRREVNNTLIQLSNEAHRVARALGELGVPSLPIITEDHAQYLHRYPPLDRKSVV